MSDHMHHKGEFMFGYRFMTMNMKNLRNESTDVNNGFVFQNYMASPQEMTMNMHMLGAMYAPSDKVTLMAMANYTTNVMDLRTKSGEVFSTKSNGFGDLSLSAMYRFSNDNHHSFYSSALSFLPVQLMKKMSLLFPIEKMYFFPMRCNLEVARLVAY